MNAKTISQVGPLLNPPYLTLENVMKIEQNGFQRTITRGVMLKFHCSKATEDLMDRQGSDDPSYLPSVEANLRQLRVKGDDKVDGLSYM
ncbi:hypothetical protein HAX54_000830 [Datura stramonium]|uniref:Uncharacterized protein n=1 Tax=Datura stramonium TaxID=4076 RepID=A0ABS8RSL5_DATST|nr:hypothetical protein [Datura stramonium]